MCSSNSQPRKKCGIRRRASKCLGLVVRSSRFDRRGASESPRHDGSRGPKDPSIIQKGHIRKLIHLCRLIAGTEVTLESQKEMED